MQANLVKTIAGAFIALCLGALLASAQNAPAPPADRTAPPPPPEQLDQMLAPIALYPDPLLAQILMAATYPLEVVEADRWLQDPNNAALKGDQLTAALDQLQWDPSVKSLVPFPQILRMMDGHLDWTEQLGDVFLADQPAVMDSVQRLRQRAEAAGNLRSTPQQMVTTEGQAIAIEPPSPDVVYVPVYDPSIVYGVWPYVGFPPFYFPGFFDGVIIGGFGFGWFGVPIIGPLWGWDHWDWGRHQIDINPGRWAALNHNRPPIGGGAWEHDPAHRHGVPYRDAATRGRFMGAGSPDARRSLRGYSAGSTAPSRSAPQGNRAPAPMVVPHSPPTFKSYGRGADVRAQAERGHTSRMSMPSFSRGGGGGSHAAPSGGRGHR